MERGGAGMRREGRGEMGGEEPASHFQDSIVVPCGSARKGQCGLRPVSQHTHTHKHTHTHNKEIKMALVQSILIVMYTTLHILT